MQHTSGPKYNITEQNELTINYMKTDRGKTEQINGNGNIQDKM